MAFKYGRLVSSAQLEPGSVTDVHIAPGAVTRDAIAPDAVGEAELSALSIEAEKWIRSVGYQPGVNGWAIDGDGRAEFNDVTVRGRVEGSEIVTSTIVSESAQLNTLMQIRDGEISYLPTENWHEWQAAYIAFGAPGIYGPQRDGALMLLPAVNYTDPGSRPMTLYLGGPNASAVIEYGDRPPAADQDLIHRTGRATRTSDVSTSSGVWQTVVWQTNDGTPDGWTWQPQGIRVARAGMYLVSLVATVPALAGYQARILVSGSSNSRLPRQRWPGTVAGQVTTLTGMIELSAQDIVTAQVNHGSSGGSSGPYHLSLTYIGPSI